MKRAINASGAPRPVGPYSQAIDVGELVFLSGQVAIDPRTGKLTDEGPGEQTTRCMENLKAVLAEAGLGLSDIVKTTLFVVDLRSFKEINEAYASFFTSDPPARSTIGVAALPLGAKVEIEAVATRAPRRSP